MTVIDYYEIVMSVYHGEPVGRLRYVLNGEAVESSLLTPSELTNLIIAWRIDVLCGSFGAGTILSPEARFILCTQ